MHCVDKGIDSHVCRSLGSLRLVLAGEKYLPSEAFSESTTSEAPSISSEIRTQQQAQQANPAFSSLTQRELEILRLLVDGLTNKQIAINLGLQEITVKIHVRNVYRKIDAKNRARAVKLTIQSGWLNA